MSDKMTPKKGYSFKDHTRTNPTKPLPGDRLDTELGRIYTALESVHQYITQTIAPDGSIKGNRIKKENIKSDVLDFWVEQIQDKIKTQLESAENAEKNTQHWLLQCKEALTLALQARDDARKANSLSLSDTALAKEAKDQALGSRQRAETAFQQAEIRAQDAETAAASARISEDMAYRWAEKLDGPVFTPSGGTPQDDGFYSARYWANYAYYTTKNGSYFYLGPHPSDPTEGPDGAPLENGMWYYNTTDAEAYIWDGTGWQLLTVTEVISVFGRDGAVIAQESDYFDFYPTIGAFQQSQADQDAAFDQSQADQDAAFQLALDGKVSLAGDTMTGQLNTPDIVNDGTVQSSQFQVKSNTRADIHLSDADERISTTSGEAARPFRFVPAINGSENLEQALSYSADDIAWYIGNLYSDDDRVLTPALGVEYFPTVKGATTFPFDSAEERHTRFVNSHSALGISSWDDLSPAGDPDWPFNQFTVRVDDTALPTQGWPDQASGDFVTSHSWGGNSGFQVAYAVNPTNTTPKMYMRSKNSNVWAGWTEVGADTYVRAGYGGIRQATPIAVGSISANWGPIPADTAVVSTPRGVIQDLTSNSLTMEEAGVWRVGIGFSIEHNEANQGRTFGVRLFDVTAGLGGGSTVVGVGRNSSVTTFSLSTLFEVQGSTVGNPIQIQVGDASTSLTEVTLNSFSFTANLASEGTA